MIVAAARVRAISRKRRSGVAFLAISLAVLLGCGDGADDVGSSAALVVQEPRWSAPMRLSTGSDPSVPEVGVADSGATLVARTQPEAPEDPRAVYVAAAPPGQTFEAPRRVGAGGGQPQLDVLPDGRAALAFAQGRSRERRVMLLRGDAAGAFSSPVAVEGAEVPDELVLASDGSALVVTAKGVGMKNADPRVDVVTVRPDGSSRRRRLGRGELPGEGILARGRDGTIALVFLRYDGRDQLDADAMVAVWRRDGRFRLVRALSGVASPQVAVAPDGRVGVVATRAEFCEEVECFGGVVATELLPGARRFGRVVRAPVRPRSEPYAFNPTIAYAGDGSRTLAWIEDISPNNFGDLDSEDSLGRSFAWTEGRERLKLDELTREVLLVGGPTGALAITDEGPWQAHAIIGRRRVRRVAAPAGQGFIVSPFGGLRSDRRLVAGGGRLVFTWLGRGALRDRQSDRAYAVLSPVP